MGGYPASINEAGDLVEYPTPTSVDEFERISILGRGTFAKVYLCRRKINNEIYAIKELKKELIIKLGEVEHTISERRILGLIDHPFLVHLYGAFQTVDKLYMVLEYAPGGELFYHLKQKTRFSESQARLYAAEIFLALEYLHNMNIVYRDLKPENVLIDAQGHIKLTDFGLSKVNLESTLGAKTFCGTAEYLAPELLQNQGHGKGVDYWALGTMIYEMIAGLPPFYSRDRKTMYRKILYADINFPPYMSESCCDIIRGFLTRDPRARLGCKATGTAEIRKHPWFKGIDWDKMYKKGYTMEYIPQCNDVYGLGNFDKCFTSTKISPSFNNTNTIKATPEEEALIQKMYSKPTQASADKLTPKKDHKSVIHSTHKGELQESSQHDQEEVENDQIVVKMPDEKKRLILEQNIPSNDPFSGFTLVNSSTPIPVSMVKKEKESVPVTGPELILDASNGTVLNSDVIVKSASETKVEEADQADSDRTKSVVHMLHEQPITKKQPENNSVTAAPKQMLSNSIATPPVNKPASGSVIQNTNACTINHVPSSINMPSEAVTVTTTNQDASVLSTSSSKSKRRKHRHYHHHTDSVSSCVSGNSKEPSTHGGHGMMVDGCIPQNSEIGSSSRSHRDKSREHHHHSSSQNEKDSSSKHHRTESKSKLTVESSYAHDITDVMINNINTDDIDKSF